MYEVLTTYEDAFVTCECVLLFDIGEHYCGHNLVKTGKTFLVKVLKKSDKTCLN